MNGKRMERRLSQRLDKRFRGSVTVKITGEAISLKGELSRWEDIVEAGRMCAGRVPGLHVVNDIVLTGTAIPKMKMPSVQDQSLEGAQPDVLIIGGGISGASIARELSRYQLDILLVDKEADLAMQASGRNDGEVHPGVDLKKGSLKQHYVLRGNQMFDHVCKELSVPFSRCGQYVGFREKYAYPFVTLYALYRRVRCKVPGTRVIPKDRVRAAEQGLNPDFAFALYNPTAGCVCPYGLTIAYGENAVENGAKISLNTAVTGMEVRNGRIQRVATNRGTLYPKVVINAAGVFAEDVAAMAEDRFYSIHPRRGTNSILDKKAGDLVHSISSIKTLAKDKSHSKGGGILHTVHNNLLVGPNAVETYEKENFATDRESIEAVFKKQRMTAPGLKESDIITYFTGVRAATYEEDFIIEQGRKTRNLVHCAGIQSPGLTTAPAVAVDVAKMTVELLREEKKAAKNPNFNPRRKAVPVMRELSKEERNRKIKENPDYGVIICRCEEISRGEILDALHSVIPVTTTDGIKKRLRPGMGRCQGGFCLPLVTQIISEELNIPLSQVKKDSETSYITFGETKEAAECSIIE